MAGETHDDATTPVGERLAEKLNMTDDDLSQMSAEELEEAAQTLKRAQSALDNAE